MIKHFVLLSLDKTDGLNGCDVVVGSDLYFAKAVKASYEADDLMELRNQIDGDLKVVISLNLVSSINDELLKVN